MPMTFQDDRPRNSSSDQGSRRALATRPSTAHDGESREERIVLEASIDLRDWLEVILRRRWMILSVLTVVLVSTLSLSLAITPVFKATGSLEISQKTPQVTKFEELLASDLRSQEFIQTQVQLLQMEELAQRVIDRLALEENPAFNQAAAREAGIGQRIKQGMHRLGSLLHNRSRTGSNPELERLLLDKELREKFLDNLAVSPQRETSIVRISFTSEDNRLASRAVNSLMQEYIDWRMDQRLQSANTANRQLEKQIQAVRVQLERSRETLNSYAKKAGIVSLDSRLNEVFKQMEEINQAFASAEGERIRKQADYRQARLNEIASHPRVVGNELIQLLRKEEADVAATYREQLTDFKEAHPRMQNLSARLQDIRERIENEEQRVLKAIRTEYLSARQRELSLQTLAAEKKDRAMQLQDKVTQYTILQQEVQTNQQIYQSLLDRSKEINANVGTGVSNVQIVSPAPVPLEPFKPDLPKNVLVAVLVGSLGGIGLSFFMEYLDNTIKRVEEVVDRYAIPVLGTVPMATGTETGLLDWQVSAKPRSVFSEAVRSARTSIQLSNSDRPLTSLLITSTTPSEGKTTLTLNLAQAFAATGQRSLIIDCDMRKPRLHTLLQGANGWPQGLSHYLNGLLGLSDIIHELEKDRLFLIPAGALPPNPSELLASTRMQQLLVQLERDYDRVFLDSPPFNGFADTLILSKQVQGIILVTALGQTHRQALQLFDRTMDQIQANVLGTIVNKVPALSGYGGYAASSKYTRGYYSDEPLADDGRTQLARKPETWE
jgi:capsular exopolysaccharide synthesis family protein